MSRSRMCNKISVFTYKNKKINKTINKIICSFMEINAILNSGCDRKCKK